MQKLHLKQPSRLVDESFGFWQRMCLHRVCVCHGGERYLLLTVAACGLQRNWPRSGRRHKDKRGCRGIRNDGAGGGKTPTEGHRPGRRAKGHGRSRNEIALRVEDSNEKIRLRHHTHRQVTRGRGKHNDGSGLRCGVEGC